MSFTNFNNTTSNGNNEDVSSSCNCLIGHYINDRDGSSLEDSFERSVSVTERDFSETGEDYDGVNDGNDVWKRRRVVESEEEKSLIEEARQCVAADRNAELNEHFDSEEKRKEEEEDLFGSDDEDDDENDDGLGGLFEGLIRKEHKHEERRRQANNLSLRDRYRYNHDQQHQETSFDSSGDVVEGGFLPEEEWTQDLYNNGDGELEFDSLNGGMDTEDENGQQQWQREQIEDQQFQQRLFQQQYLRNQQWQQFHQQHFEPDPHQPVDYNQLQQQLVGRSYAGGNDLWQCSQNFHYRHWWERRIW